MPSCSSLGLTIILPTYLLKLCLLLYNPLTLWLSGLLQCGHHYKKTKTFFSHSKQTFINKNKTKIIYLETRVLRLSVTFTQKIVVFFFVSLSLSSFNFFIYLFFKTFTCPFFSFFLHCFM